MFNTSVCIFPSDWAFCEAADCVTSLTTPVPLITSVEVHYGSCTVMIRNRWWLTWMIPPTPLRPPLTVPPHVCVGLRWHVSSPAGGRGRLRGRRRRQDAVQRERARRRQRAQLPGAHGGGRRRLHFARGWTDDVEEHNGHEAVQPALGHHVSRLPENASVVMATAIKIQTH